MKNRNQIFALIPARKGSKGVKNKNIVKLNNKHLIEHTIIQVLKSKIVDKIFVSSNDERILKITNKYKKVYYITRKNYLSNSKALLKDVIINFLNLMENKFSLKKINLIILQPTSPQRRVEDIDKAIKLFFKKKKFPLISVSEPISNPNDVIYLNRNKISFFNKKFINQNRQKFKKCFYVNGSIYITNGENYIKNPSFLTKNSTIYKMDKKHSIEIDDYFDLKIIKNIIL